MSNRTVQVERSSHHEVDVIADRGFGNTVRVTVTNAHIDIEFMYAGTAMTKSQRIDLGTTELKLTHTL